MGDGSGDTIKNDSFFTTRLSKFFLKDVNDDFITNKSSSLHNISDFFYEVLVESRRDISFEDFSDFISSRDMGELEVFD